MPAPLLGALVKRQEIAPHHHDCDRANDKPPHVPAHRSAHRIGSPQVAAPDNLSTSALRSEYSYSGPALVSASTWGTAICYKAQKGCPMTESHDPGALHDQLARWTA